MKNYNSEIGKELEAIRSEGLFKEERIITSPQAASIQMGKKACTTKRQGT